MRSKEPAHFDPKTVALLREVLEHAWTCLPSECRKNTSRSVLAERILKAAAAGERDRERLLDAAFIDVAA